MKKVISVFLIFMLIFLTSVVAFAQHNIDNAIIDFESYCSSVAEELNLSGYSFYEPVAGDAFLDYTLESTALLREELSNADNLIYSYYNGEEVTLKQIDEQRSAIELAYDELILVKEDLEFLICFCQGENNNDNYYDADTWQDYLNCISNAQAVYDDETITDKRVTKAFWDLLFAYNSLCLSNSIIGDVDGDGKVTILDVTLIQRYIAKGVSFNSSQKFVSAITFEYPATTINDATLVQKYSAKMIDNDDFGKAFDYLEMNVNSTNIKSNSLFYNEFWEYVFY